MQFSPFESFESVESFLGEPDSTVFNWNFCHFPFLPVHICWCFWTEHKASTTQKWLGGRQDLAGLGEKALRRWETSRLNLFCLEYHFDSFLVYPSRCCHGALATTTCYWCRTRFSFLHLFVVSCRLRQTKRNSKMKFVNISRYFASIR